MVVLPEPDGPISVTRSPLPTWKLSSFSTVWSPNLFTTSSKMIPGDASDCCAADAWVVSSVLKFLLQLSHQDSSRVAGGQEDQAGDGERFDVAELHPAELPRPGDHLSDVDEDQVRGVLEHRDRSEERRVGKECTCVCGSSRCRKRTY